jgi:hypothetical protein
MEYWSDAGLQKDNPYDPLLQYSTAPKLILSWDQ